MKIIALITCSFSIVYAIKASQAVMNVAALFNQMRENVTLYALKERIWEIERNRQYLSFELLKRLAASRPSALYLRRLQKRIDKLDAALMDARTAIRRVEVAQLQAWRKEFEERTQSIGKKLSIAVCCDCCHQRAPMDKS